MKEEFEHRLLFEKIYQLLCNGIIKLWKKIYSLCNHSRYYCAIFLTNAYNNVTNAKGWLR